jgi:hypothetical protein
VQWWLLSAMLFCEKAPSVRLDITTEFSALADRLVPRLITSMQRHLADQQPQHDVVASTTQLRATEKRTRNVKEEEQI